MDPTELEGNWEQQKLKLLKKFTTLRESDVDYEEGKKEDMLCNLQEKLGKTKEELNTIISELK